MLTREEGNAFPGCTTAHTIEEAIAIAHRTHDVAFAIGGARDKRVTNR
ncbi:MAG TPA: hypothetical protein PLZ60_10660 [Kiritimatiellia bacterium]|nr:hypothetical protein [Kiritimatiellia bacterium]